MGIGQQNNKRGVWEYGFLLLFSLPLFTFLRFGAVAVAGVDGSTEMTARTTTERKRKTQKAGGWTKKSPRKASVLAHNQTVFRHSADSTPVLLL